MRDADRAKPGWIVPPPREPTKSPAELARERVAKVDWLVRHGYLRSDRIRLAMLKVPREAFIPPGYRDYAYLEVPLPLPGERATISCPHSYPLFYEALGLDRGHRFIEIGLGSGHGTALAREIVGPEGLVVSVEIDPETLAFGRHNLEQAGYRDVVLVEGDGGQGHPERSPYDRIAVTGAGPRVPPPLLHQLATGGRLVIPLLERSIQNLTLVEKGPAGVSRRILCQVGYVSLRGAYGDGGGSPEARTG
jgi:protein-L-isoaspartate(D-aspartate) O-methyltransferase